MDRELMEQKRGRPPMNGKKKRKTGAMGKRKR